MWDKVDKRAGLQLFEVRFNMAHPTLSTNAGRGNEAPRVLELKAILREARFYVASIAADDDRSVERELLARIDAALDR